MIDVAVERVDVEHDVLLRRADENLMAFIRHTAWAGDDTTISEEAGLLLVAGSHRHPGPYRNAVFNAGASDPERALAQASAFFAERERGFVFWAPHHGDPELRRVLAEAGGNLLEEGGLPELYLERRPDLVSPPEGVELRLAKTEKEREDFLLVNAAGWGMEGLDLTLARKTFFDPRSLDHPTVAGVIAYRDGEPLATAMALVSNHAVGGYWGATAPQARRQGLADVVVRAMFNAGFDIGANLAVCQASGAGESIWRRMGFRDLTRYDRFLFPAGWDQR